MSSSSTSSNKSPAKRKSAAETLPDITDADAEPIPGCSSSSPSLSIAESQRRKKKKVSFLDTQQDSQPFFTDDEDEESIDVESDSDSDSSTSSSSADTDIVISSDEEDNNSKGKKKIDKVKISQNGQIITRTFRSASSRKLKATLNRDNKCSFLTLRKRAACGHKTTVLDEKAAQNLVKIHDKFLKKCRKLQAKNKHKKSTTYLIKKDLKKTSDDVSVSLVKIKGYWFVALSNWTRSKNIHISVDDYLAIINFVLENIK